MGNAQGAALSSELDGPTAFDCFSPRSKTSSRDHYQPHAVPDSVIAGTRISVTDLAIPDLTSVDGMLAPGIKDGMASIYVCSDSELERFFL